jgi:hypothetical protein
VEDDVPPVDVVSGSAHCDDPNHLDGVDGLGRAGLDLPAAGLAEIHRGSVTGPPVDLDHGSSQIGLAGTVAKQSRARYVSVPSSLPEGGIGLAVLIRHRPQGLGPADYDEMSPPLVEQVKQQPGFILHVSFEDSQGFCVAEIWESQEQHDAFFNANVAPNIPAEIKQEVIQLHSLHRP